MSARKKRKPLSYFYLNGLLHRKLYINRSADTITAWCYPQAKRVAYTYSDVKNRKEPAFTTMQVCKMINRSRVTVEKCIMYGNIEQPQFTYGLNEARKKYQYLWHESNVLELHAYLSTLHRGGPRHDGVVIPYQLPSIRELRAMMRQEEALYVKNDAGEFVPVWKAVNFD